MHHKKSVRALALHPTKFIFASGSADNLKQWKMPEVPPTPLFFLFLFQNKL